MKNCLQQEVPCPIVRCAFTETKFMPEMVGFPPIDPGFFVITTRESEKPGRPVNVRMDSQNPTMSGDPTLDREGCPKF